ncbi:MAG: hypothetical protein ACP5KW_01460 [Thermoproteota archaeon]|jgi:hypothetical protein
MKRGRKNRDVKEYALRRMKEIIKMAEKMSGSGYYWTEPYFFSELQNLAYEFDEAFLLTEGEGDEEVNVFYFMFNNKYYRLYFRSSEEPMFAEETSEEEYRKRKMELYSQNIRRKR